MFQQTKNFEPNINIMVWVFLGMLILTLPTIAQFFEFSKEVVHPWFNKDKSSNYLFIPVAVGEVDNPYEGDEKAIKDGRKIFALKGCSANWCHGVKGKGSRAPSLITGKFKRSDGSNSGLMKVILEGVPGSPMRGFAGKIDEEGALKLIAYMRWETQKNLEKKNK